ncbi:cytochrome b [Variovorax sp. N23]|uniref:cytochrome b n=1 Tax=Variovorax sp. N23 TaxID=2980555 RepID=UPI0021C85ACC|nr:cytochrome b [Variovorax sp. N23]MCU4122159.1 cytochrome b [Variovorax sp. N23]
MPWKNTTSRYGTLVIGLHWLMLLLLVAVYATMELRGWAPKGSALRDSLKPLHFMLGLTVLALVAVRIVSRIGAGRAPAIVPAAPRWQSGLSHLMHLALYAFLVAMPILGWAVLSAEGKPIVFFGFPVPPLIAPDADLADQIQEVHEALASVGYVLIGLHAVAALYHHYVQRDNTLRRMLPGRG